MNSEERKQLITTIDNDEKKARQFFKMAYNYDNLKTDFTEWRKHWLSLTFEEKDKLVSKGVREGDFEKVLAALHASKGNPFKAYKLLKALKKEQNEKQSK